MPGLPNRYALIIGVDDYAAFDASVQNAPGTNNLRGCVRDAFGYAALAIRAGFPAENLRLLLSPVDRTLGPPPDLVLPEERALPEGLSICGLVATGTATQDEILAGLGWLAQALAGDPGAVGMLAFAGHGSCSGNDLLLCGSDTTAGLREAVPFDQVEQILGEASRTASLTVFLETCHAAGMRRRKAQARALWTEPLPELLVARSLRLEGPVLTACKPAEQALEMPFGSARRGAFSLAVEMVLSRFSTGDPAAPYAISAQDTVSRCREVMVALGLTQRPVCRGAAQDQALLAPRGTPVPVEGGIARLFGQELWPDTSEQVAQVYDLALVDPQANGSVVVIGGSSIGSSDPNHPFQPSRAYWYYPKVGSTVINPFSTGNGFNLTPSTTETACGFSPLQANAVFEDTAFSGTASSQTLSGGYELRQGPSNAPVVGYMTVQWSGSVVVSQNWVQLGQGSSPDACVNENSNNGPTMLAFKVITGTTNCTGWRVVDQKV